MKGERKRERERGREREREERVKLECEKKTMTSTVIFHVLCSLSRLARDLPIYVLIAF